MFTTKLPTAPTALAPRCFNISAFISLRNLNARSSISACRTGDSVMFRNPTPVFFIRRWAHRSAIICRQFDRRHHAKRPQRVTVAGKFFSCAHSIARCAILRRIPKTDEASLQFSYPALEGGDAQLAQLYLGIQKTLVDSPS